MLVAILLVALATIIAAAVAYESAMSARRGSSTFDFEQAVLVGEGAEAVAAIALQQTFQNLKSATADIYPGQQPWGNPLGPVEVVPGVTLEASLEDLQGRFNLNWLVTRDATGKQVPNPTMVTAFNHLLEYLHIETKWTDLLIDWIDNDTTPMGDGAEDSAYLGKNPPYLTANRYITSASELLALGIERENYQKLALYVTALPPSTTLNVCSASPYVLDAMYPGTQQHREWSVDPDSFYKARTSAGGCYPTVQQYQGTFDLGGANATVSGAGGGIQGGSSLKPGNTSQYFRLNSLITIGTTEFNLYSLLYVDLNGHFVHPIQRSFSAD